MYNRRHTNNQAQYRFKPRAGKADIMTTTRTSSDYLSISEKFQRGELMSADCPSREILRHITSRWGLLVLISLSSQTLRFNELRKKICGISEKMLAQTLQALEEDGFVKRIAYPVVPPHVEYCLTPLGDEVKAQLTGLADWLETNLHRILQHRQKS
jgi:DNA-binding HxlR family transcriptional regulator